jgi:hypothetical protein
MVAQRFGKADPDIRKGSKETRDKPMLKASARTNTTGLIGGTSNEVANTSSAKSGRTMSFAKGGKVLKSYSGG